MLLRFEYEIRENGLFDLYERGGDHLICLTGLNDNIQYERSPNEKLDMLYPIAKVDFDGDIKNSFKKAITQFLENFHDIGIEFEFVAKNLSGSVYMGGKIKPKGKGRADKTLDSIEFYEYP